MGYAKCSAIAKYIFVWYSFYGEDLFEGLKLRMLLGSCKLNHRKDQLTSSQVERIIDIIMDLRRFALLTPNRFTNNMIECANQKAVNKVVKSITKNDVTGVMNYHNAIVSYASER